MFDCSRRWADIASRYLELATNQDVSQLVTTLVRVHEARERDQSYARFQERPFPGNPITAGLTNHEAAELSGRLHSAHTVSGKLPTVNEPRNSP